MTNEELLAKIKAEINKLYGEYKDKFHQSGDQYHLGLIDGLDMAERVLDTLESERTEPYNPVYDEAYLNEKIKKATESWKGVDVDAMLAECRGYDEEKSEKPMNQDGLEEEINRLWESFADEMEGPHNLFDIYARLARHFAKWGSEHLATSGKTSGGSSEIPNCLNELADYARRQVEELLPVIKKYNDYSEEQIEELRTHLMAMFLEGAGWQKEQILKEAVPFYEILEAVPPGPERENVRIIIVKED